MFLFTSQIEHFNGETQEYAWQILLLYIVLEYHSNLLFTQLWEWTLLRLPKIKNFQPYHSLQ